MGSELTTQNAVRERWSGILGRFGPGWLLAAWMAFGLAAVLGVSIWGVRSLGGLPDIGDPFDVAAARRPIAIADEDNAYVAYAAADAGGFRFPAALAKVDFKALTWSEAGPDVRAFLDQKRSVLEIWRQGSERPDALYHQPGAGAVDTLLPVSQDMRLVALLAGLEGSRLEDDGAMGRAWEWYRAMLRFSRHVGRHGCLIERHIGAAVHEVATGRILRWAADPRVDAGQLRRALDETLAADALTAPLSDALKFEYLIYLRDLDELRVMVDFKEVPLPGGKGGLMEGLTSQMGIRAPVQRALLRASNDVERSRRAMRLLFANWLAQVDRPAAQRAGVAVREPVLIYATDPTAPSVANAVSPEFLAKALNHNALSRNIFHFDEPSYRPYQAEVWEGKGPLARERRRRPALIVRLAAELFRREQRTAPATAGALLGPFLKELPAGIAPGDPIPAAIE
jgi:hypothetical protein